MSKKEKQTVTNIQALFWVKRIKYLYNLSNNKIASFEKREQASMLYIEMCKRFDNRYPECHIKNIGEGFYFAI